MTGRRILAAVLAGLLAAGAGTSAFAESRETLQNSSLEKQPEVTRNTSRGEHFELLQYSGTEKELKSAKETKRQAADAEERTNAAKPNKKSTKKSAKKSTKKSTKKVVRLVAVGDNIIHSNLIKTAKKKGRYNFNPMYRYVRKDIRSADLAVINQETIMVKHDYSGYPAFGSPYQVADAVADTGFDIVTQATNHTMDRGTAAVTGTLKYWRKNHPQITVLGIHSSSKQASRIRVVKKNGIRIAMLNYTYGLNTGGLPSGKGYLVDRLGESHKKKIASDIRSARKKSDFVIVFAHWGTEYRYTPDSYQKSWAGFFADHGVDLVIGAHPHVVEPMKTVKGKNGHRMVCYYSLGNFISDQPYAHSMLGAMADLTIVKDKKGTRIRDRKMIPLVTHIGRKHSYFRVYRLSDYTEALAKKNYIRHSDPGFGFSKKSIAALYRKITK